MASGLSQSDIQMLRTARRYLAIWRYVKWAQFVAGLFVAGYGFTLLDGDETRLLFGVLHPVVLGALGATMIGEVLWDRKAQERGLLLRLAAERDAGR